MENQFCCDFFTENIMEAGRKGFSIIPCKVDIENSYYFLLQFRSLDYKEESDSNVIISQRAIKYCPWCGTKLSDIVKSHKKGIEQIADRYKHLVV